MRGPAKSAAAASVSLHAYGRKAFSLRPVKVAPTVVGVLLYLFFAGWCYPIWVTPEEAFAAIEGSAATYTVLSQYTTFLPERAGRTKNIRLAAHALNGRTVAAGETFSFNRAVGPRTLKAGYKAATVIENGEYVSGVGGGICQLASTLYQAVLLGGLPVLERHAHSVTVDYIDPGLDAAVAYGLCDLRFRNNTGGPLRLEAEVEGNRLTVRILAEAGERPQVTLKASIVGVLPPPPVYWKEPDLPFGKTLLLKEGRPGLEVEVTRSIRRRDGRQRVEKISRDTYRPLPRIVLVGVARSGSRP